MRGECWIRLLSVYVRGGRGQYRDRWLDAPNRSVAQLSVRTANTSKWHWRDRVFGGGAQEVH